MTAIATVARSAAYTVAVLTGFTLEGTDTPHNACCCGRHYTRSASTFRPRIPTTKILLAKSKAVAPGGRSVPDDGPKIHPAGHGFVNPKRRAVLPGDTEGVVNEALPGPQGRLSRLCDNPVSRDNSS